MRGLTSVAGAVAAALVIGSAAITGGAGAEAATTDASPPATLYVNQSVATCSDQGAGTQDIPFCTIQAAANVASPGQTVDILANYAQPVTITRSGTPGAPITFTFPGAGTSQPSFYPYKVTGGPLFTLKDVHDVTISNLTVDHWGTDDGVDVIGSSGIWLDRLTVWHKWPTTSDELASTDISIDGASSDVTVSRTQFMNPAQYELVAHQGAQRVTVTTNSFIGLNTPGITLDGAVNAVVTGNTVIAHCNSAAGPVTALTLMNGTSAVVENNDLEAGPGAACPAGGAALSVDASSAASAGGVKADYNSLFASAADTEYSWAGMSYGTAAAFQAAVPGEGAHDLDLPLSGTKADTTPDLDSADCSAPGEFGLFSTDYRGQPRDVTDPQAADASYGNGTCHADRGAYETQDTFTQTVTPSAAQVAAGQAVTVSLAGSATSGWGEPVSSTVDFGDGDGPAPVTAGGPPASHVYTTPGPHTVTVTLADTGGSVATRTTGITVYTAQPPQVTLAATVNASGFFPQAATFTYTGAAAPDAWEIKSVSLDPGNGTVYSMALGQGLTSTYPYYGYQRAGIYTATLTATDGLGRTSTAKATVTVGDQVVPKAPQRAYAHTVAAHSFVRLSASQLHIAHGDSAALVTITVTNATKAGYVIVYPAGTARPNRAAVQWAAGQSASNVALAGGKDVNNTDVDFYNGSSGPVNLVITTIGSEVTYQGDRYVPVTPAQVLPATRIPGNHYVAFAVAGHAGVPSNADAVVLDVTSSSGTAAGHFVTYPEKSPAGQMQGAYWNKGQAATGLAVVPVGGGRAGLKNVGSGAATFTAQVIGYYVKGTGAVYLPAAPRRLLTVQVAGKHWVKLPVSGNYGVPATAAGGSGTTAVAVNLTALGSPAGGTIIGYADGTARPGITSLSYSAGETVANDAIIAVGQDGAIDLYNSGLRPVTIVVDLSGSYYAY